MKVTRRRRKINFVAFGSQNGESDMAVGDIGCKQLERHRITIDTKDNRRPGSEGASAETTKAAEEIAHAHVSHCESL